MIKVDPYIPNPTHHISLTDKYGRTVGLLAVDGNGNQNAVAIKCAPLEANALKTASGAMSWGDMEYPWAPAAQESFIGGRGMAEFESDASKYADGKRANTILGKILHAPQEQLLSGYLSMDSSLPGSVDWRAIRGNRSYIAVKFTASSSYDAANIYFHLRRTGTPTGTLTIALADDNVGVPGANLQTDTLDINDITDVVSELYKFTITAQSLTSGSDYWLKIYDPDGTADNHWEIGVKDSSGTTVESADGSTWGTTASYDLYYLIHALPTTYRPMFFQYKRATYMLLNPESGAPLLYINGDRGVADANTGALGTLKDGSKTWVLNEFIGGVALIIGGTGQTESTPYRNITANTTAGVVSISPDWAITHDTTTEYVIVGTNVMKLVSGHGLTAPVTDILIINDIVYFAQGDSTNIRRFMWDQNSNAERSQYADDGTNKATLIKPLLDQTDGLIIALANNTPTKKISTSPVKNWGTNLVLTEEYVFKDEWGRITWIYAYGSPQYLWVWREGTVFQYKDGYMDEIPLAEYHTMMMDNNGYNALPHNIYLYFPFRYGGLERYYNASLDDVGPNRDEGMPQGRQGYISKLLGYPGVIFVIQDGGTTDTSSIMAYNQQGYCEIYRAPAAGMRIQDAIFQVIPGLDHLDRMLIYVGGLLFWLPFPKKALDPTKDDNYMFYHEAVMESGWVYSDLVDLYKFYNSVKTWAENLAENEQYIKVDIKIDDDSAWTQLSGQLSAVPIDEIFIGDDIFGEGGRRIKIRIRSWTNNNKKSPEIKTIVIDTATRIPVRYSYGCRFRSIDGDIDLNGNMNEISTSKELMALLYEWAENMTPLRMRCVYELFDDKRVFIDTIPSSPLKEKKEGYIGEIVINQVKRQAGADIPIQTG